MRNLGSKETSPSYTPIANCPTGESVRLIRVHNHSPKGEGVVPENISCPRGVPELVANGGVVFCRRNCLKE